MLHKGWVTVKELKGSCKAQTVSGEKDAHFTCGGFDCLESPARWKGIEDVTFRMGEVALH